MPGAMVRKRNRDSRRLFALALIASAVLHLLVLAAVRFDTIVSVVGGADAQAFAQPAMRVLDVVEVADAAGQTQAAVAPAAAGEAAQPPAPRNEARAVEAVRIPTVGAVPEATPPETAGGDRSIMDRLRGEPGGVAVWRVPAQRPPLPLEGIDAAQARIAAGVSAYNDSMIIAMEAAARALDWTFQDGSGNKWGVSPGKLHLGPITLPLPIGFSAPADIRAEMNRRVGEWNAIQVQRARADVEEIIKERTRAIQARKAAADTSKSGGSS